MAEVCARIAKKYLMVGLWAFKKKMCVLFLPQTGQSK